MAIIIMHSVTPKVGAQHELLFNKPASACCNYFCVKEFRWVGENLTWEVCLLFRSYYTIFLTSPLISQSCNPNRIQSLTHNYSFIVIAISATKATATATATATVIVVALVPALIEALTLFRKQHSSYKYWPDGSTGLK
jgi:hypothetical protein